MIESNRARDLAEPDSLGSASRVIPPPSSQRLLERLAREVLRQPPVRRKDEQVTKHVIQMVFRDLSEAPPERHPRRPGMRERIHNSYYVAVSLPGHISQRMTLRSRGHNPLQLARVASLL
jgi:hypothetical protein